MATHDDIQTGAHAKTLSGTTADTVQYRPGRSSAIFHVAVRLSNTTGSAPLYVRWDGTTAVSAADGTYGVPSGMFDVYDLGLLGDKDVSVVGSGNVYSAEFLIVDPAVAD